MAGPAAATRGGPPARPPRTFSSPLPDPYAKLLTSCLPASLMIAPPFMGLPAGLAGLKRMGESRESVNIGS